MAKRGAARGTRLTCPKCAVRFTVVALLSQGVDAAEYWKGRADEHDCEAHVKTLAAGRSGDVTKNPLKASKAAARGRK